MTTLALDGLCAACWLDAEEEFFDLATAATTPERVPQDRPCPKCGLPMGRPATRAAQDRILDLLAPELA